MKTGITRKLLNFFVNHLAQGALIAGALFGIAANAKIMDITLSELVEKSEVIVYGQSIPPSQSPRDTKVATFLNPIIVIKGAIDEKKPIHLCKTPSSSESYDFGAAEDNYIVFIAKNGNCYSLVYWYKSVVRVKNDLAETVAISDQPDDQPLSDFIKKIQSFSK